MKEEERRKEGGEGAEGEPRAGRPRSDRGRLYQILDFRRVISAGSILVKPKHLRPRSFREAPTR